MNIRLSRFDEKKESHMITKIIAKTALTGVSSHWINLSVNEHDLKKLYTTIDLTGKLIVLEDLERSSIDIIDILGFVNNLTEQDKVKVLLVANEGEIVNALEMRNQTEVIDYIRKKEKTIGDTIKFVCNKEDTIKNIFNTVFDEKECIKDLKNDVAIKELANIMPDYKCNWRSFLYACQKTIDIFDKYEENANAKPLNFDFKKETLIRTIRYCLKRDSGMNEKQLKDEKSKQFNYNNKTDYDYIGFVVNYINYQVIDIEEVKNTNDFYVRISDKTKKENLFQKAFEHIHSYYYRTDKEIEQALQNINNLLKENGISLDFYGKLLQDLMYIKYNMELDKFNILIDGCISLMKQNIDDIPQEDINRYSQTMWQPFWEDDSKELIEEHKRHRDEIDQRITERQLEKRDIDYSHDKFESLVESLDSIKNKSYTDRCFLKKIDIKKFIALLGECSSYETETIRVELQDVYKIGIVMNDKEYLNQLCEGIKNDILKKELQASQRLQFKWFLKNMENYLAWLEQPQTIN